MGLLHNVFYTILFSLGLCLCECSWAAANNSLYKWVDDPKTEAQHVGEAGVRLRQAMANPEFMLDNWVELPTSPAARKKKI